MEPQNNGEGKDEGESEWLYMVASVWMAGCEEISPRLSHFFCLEKMCLKQKIVFNLLLNARIM